MEFIDQILTESGISKIRVIQEKYAPYQYSSSTRWWQKIEQYVAEKDNSAISNFLNNNKILISKTDRRGNGLLHYAAKTNSEYLIEYLLSLSLIDFFFNDKNQLGITPIAVAVMHDSEKVLKLLLKTGVPIENKDFVRSFGLVHLAVYFGAWKCFEALIEAGFDVNGVDDDDWSPLHVAVLFEKCRNNPENPRFIKKLVHNKSLVNGMCSLGRTALDYACLYGYVDGIKLLLKAGANLVKKYNFKRTPLIFALHYHHLDAVKLLIDAGANIDGDFHFTDIHITPLTYACWMGYARINDLLNRKRTILMTNGVLKKIEKIQNDQYEAAKLLIDAGAKVDDDREKPITSLYYASVSLNLELMKLLLRKGAKINHGSYNLIYRVIMSKIMQPSIDYSEENRLNLDEVVTLSCTTKMIDRQADCIKLLLYRGENVNGNDISYPSNSSIYSPIDATLHRSHSRIITLLLNNGANYVHTLHNIVICPVVLQSMREVIKYAVKSKYARDIGRLDDNKPTRHKLSEIYDRCVNELGIAKKALCWSKGTITYLDLLIGRRVEACARNPNLMIAVKRRNVEKKFPIYGTDIMGRVDEAKGRLKLFRKATPILYRLMGRVRERDCPDVVDCVLGYLSDCDLGSLTETFG